MDCMWSIKGYCEMIEKEIILNGKKVKVLVPNSLLEKEIKE